MNPDWLDAFTPEDFADPSLRALDRAVDRLSPQVRRRRPTGGFAIGALVAIAALFFVLLRSPPAPEPVGVVREAPEPAPPARSEEPAPSVVTAPAAPRHPPPDPPRAPLPGLVAAPGTIFEARGDQAVLAQGHLSYRHDANHDPGVASIGLGSLPVVLTPVGTTFHVEARNRVAMVAVDEGTVQVVHHDGDVLATLVAPAEAVLLDDAPTVRVVPATQTALDDLLARVPAGCRCSRADVVTTIARLRLAQRSPWRTSP